MYRAILACLLVTLASASVKDSLFDGLKGSVLAGLKGKLKQDKPEPCCAPPYFTSDFAITFAYAEDGELQEEFQSGKYAYDEIEEKIAVVYHLAFTNGTRESFTLLALYNEGVVYIVYDGAAGQECYKNELSERFAKECIAEDAEYAGTTTLGDRALGLDSWYRLDTSSGYTADLIIRSVQEESCVPVFLSSRSYDAETAEQYSIISVTNLDFSLGIYDEDEVFKVPDVCEKAKDISERPEGARKIHRLSSVYGYVGK